MVQHGKVFPPSHGGRLVPSGLRALIGVSNNLDACPVRFQQLRRLIGGPVVNNDYLKVREGLGKTESIVSQIYFSML